VGFGKKFFLEEQNVSLSTILPLKPTPITITGFYKKKCLSALFDYISKQTPKANMAPYITIRVALTHLRYRNPKPY
jgi:hypothetical protein